MIEGAAVGYVIERGYAIDGMEGAAVGYVIEEARQLGVM